MGGQPQAQQVPALGRVVVVGVGLAGMQDLGVVQQLDVPGLELHLQVERRVISDPFEQFQGFGLLGGQPRRLLVALGVADVPADEEDPGRAVDVEDDRQAEERGLAR